ncbi:MAG: ABC transporter substrate-binding protein [Archangiaceae bacterium]|nr:ABC transporter substrate-binding protein [Archangiaceae bacterium]
MKRECVAALAACVVAGCSSPPAKQKVQLGGILSVTQDLANIGSDQLEAVQLAIDEINKAGGVNDAELSIINKDDASDANTAVMSAEALIELKVPVVIGAVGSGKTVAAAAKLIPAKTVFISASSTSPEITTLADDNYVFRTCPSDALQGKLVAKRAKARSFTKVAIIHIPDAYGTGLADAFADAFTSGGGTVTIKQPYVEGQQSYASLLATVYTGNPEAILLVGYAVDGAQIINDYLANYAAKNTFFYFTDGLEDVGFISAVGSTKFANLLHEGTGPATLSSDTYKAYADSYKAKYGRDVRAGSFSPSAYDAVYLAALAMAAGKANTSLAVHDHLGAVSQAGTKYAPKDFATARDAAAAGTDIDFDGASGDVDLDVHGEPVAPYDVWKVTSGAFEVLEAAVNP